MTNKMRTRVLGSMTNGEVEKYLERSDIIIIPVGTVETHGMYPLDCEYVLAEAYARLIAEKVDGLVLTGLTCFHPGATQVGRGTVHMSMTDGFNYVKAIAESLLQQGFRRQIYIPGHQPVSQFLLPMCTQFFDENKVPIFYLDMIAYLQAHGAMPAMFDPNRKPAPIVSTDEQVGRHATIIGSYKVCGRLADFPCGAEVNDERYLSTAYTPTEGDMALFELLKSRPTLLSCSPAFYYSDVAQHGSALLPETKEEIEREAEYGERELRRQIDMCDFQIIVNSLKTVDKYQNSVIMELHGDHLPRNKWSPNVVKEV
jgi:creatinine amidohydrolase